MEPPDNLVIVNDYSTMRDSFLVDITEYLEMHRKVSLVIVDVFQKIKKPKRVNESDYDDIYENFTPLKELADKYNISLMLVMHNRKNEDPTDPFSNALGSSAIMGASDQMLVIQKKERKDVDATLSVTGRTVEAENMRSDLTSHCVSGKCWEMRRKLPRKEPRMSMIRPLL